MRKSETSNIKTITETLEYGDSVKSPEIPKKDIVSLEDIAEVKTSK